MPLACHQLSGNYGKPPHHPQLSDISGRLPTRELATIRTRLHRSETADRGPSSAVNHQPPILKPQPFSVGVFSCLIAPVPAYSCGFLRTPADFASRPNWPFPATFHSLLAIPRSGLAPWNWPEVRKGHKSAPYRSKFYARTNQAVVFCIGRGRKPPLFRE